VPSHLPLRRIANPADPPHQRLGSPFPQPAPSRDRASGTTGAPLGAISSALPEIANPIGVDTEVVSDTGIR
jgi:hypothetical protein